MLKVANPHIRTKVSIEQLWSPKDVSVAVVEEDVTLRVERLREGMAPLP